MYRIRVEDEFGNPITRREMLSYLRIPLAVVAGAAVLGAPIDMNLSSFGTEGIEIVNKDEIF